MQWLAAISVKRPVFATVLVLLLGVVGLFSYFGLGVDRFPKADFPVVLVTTVLPGAAPEEIEREVTDRVESAINTVSGIDELRSTSVEGVSQVVVTFVLDKDIDVAAQEVRDKVSAIVADLPAGVEMPTVSKMDPDATPILSLALSSDDGVRDVTELADKTIRRELESLPGVGEVKIVGGRERQVNLRLDPSRLDRFALTGADVARALATQNIEIPAGRVEAGSAAMTLRTRGRVASIEAVGAIVLADRDGVAVHLRDVAAIEDGMADAESVAFMGSRAAVLLNIRKQSGENTLEVVAAVKARLAAIEPRLPAGYSMRIGRDQSEYIANAIGAVKEHLVLGGVLAAVIVLLFLRNGRSTVIAAVAIPTSVVATFGLMKAFGFTLNAITLLALTLAVGIVIDDAIVVLENIYRRIEEKGEDPFTAAIEGTKEIGLAVLATTLSLIAVFLPVAFMDGIVGRFMNSFGLTMAFAIVVSLLVSFTLTPMMSARWLRAPSAAEKASSKSSRFYAPIERVYMAALRWSMGHRWAIVLISVLALASTPFLAGAADANFLPDEDESQFQVAARAPEGTSLDETRVVATRLARTIEAIPGVAFTLTSLGDDPQRTPNLATIYVKLAPIDARDASQGDVMMTTRAALVAAAQAEHLRVNVGAIPTFSGGSHAAVAFAVKGPDFGTISGISASLLETLKAQPGVVDADTSLVDGKPELRAEIDRAKAADLGVSVVDVAQALRLLVGGAKVSTFRDGGEQYDVVARAVVSARSDVGGLRRMTVPSTKLGAVTLDHIVTFHEATGPARIDRLNRERQVTLTANLEHGHSQRAITDALNAAVAGMDLDPRYAAAPVGNSKELEKSLQAFLLAFGLALVFMYLILAAQFESWLHPITILLSLPLTVPFALLSIILFGQSLNIFSMLGIIVLFGVVKKNSILQIDHTIKLRAEGATRAHAILEANRDRLRPILMTTAAFVAGMIPLVLGSGAGAGQNRATGFVIIGGQTLALMLTLLATPVAYSLFDDLSVWIARRARKAPEAAPVEAAQVV